MATSLILIIRTIPIHSNMLCFIGLRVDMPQFVAEAYFACKVSGDCDVDELANGSW